MSQEARGSSLIAPPSLINLKIFPFGVPISLFMTLRDHQVSRIVFHVKIEKRIDIKIYFNFYFLDLKIKQLECFIYKKLLQKLYFLSNAEIEKC